MFFLAIKIIFRIYIIFYSWETYEKKLFEYVSSFFNVVRSKSDFYILMPKLETGRSKLNLKIMTRYIKILWSVFHLFLSFSPKILNLKIFYFHFILFFFPKILNFKFFYYHNFRQLVSKIIRTKCIAKCCRLLSDFILHYMDKVFWFPKFWFIFESSCLVTVNVLYHFMKLETNFLNFGTKWVFPSFI